MTTPAFCTEQSVRDIIDLNAAGSSRYSSDTIASNIRDASWFLERATGRIFRDEPTLTLKFTTNGQATVYIPGLRTPSSALLNGAGLTADTSYWLIPDVQQTGLSLAVQLRPFNRGQGSNWYLGIPDWFERNLDSPKWNGNQQSSLPNDLVIAGAWGYTDATLPEPIRRNAARLAAFYTLRSDALLSGARATDTGIFDLSNLPIEVQEFIASWKAGPQAVGT